MYYINNLKQELGTAKTYEHNLFDEKYVVDRHRCHMAAKFGVFFHEDHSKLHTLYWLPNLFKRPYQSRFIDNCSSCTTTGLSIILAFCLTAIKSHVIKYCETFCERNGKIYFGLKASLTLIATVLLCFLLGYGLKMCILLGYNPQIIFCHFFTK